jgi:hypothetical protein
MIKSILIILVLIISNRGYCLLYEAYAGYIKYITSKEANGLVIGFDFLKEFQNNNNIGGEIELNVNFSDIYYLNSNVYAAQILYKKYFGKISLNVSTGVSLTQCEIVDWLDTAGRYKGVYTPYYVEPIIDIGFAYPLTRFFKNISPMIALSYRINRLPNIIDGESPDFVRNDYTDYLDRIKKYDKISIDFIYQFK